MVLSTDKVKDGVMTSRIDAVYINQKKTSDKKKFKKIRKMGLKIKKLLSCRLLGRYRPTTVCF